MLNALIEKNETEIACYLLPEQLRVGAFVELELPWFKHNFAVSSFKIKTEKQLREVLGLRLTRYRYDPERSDMLRVEQAVIDAAEEISLESEVAEVIVNTLSAKEHARKRFLAEREVKIQKVERAFAKAAGMMKSLNRNLLSKPQETLDDMSVLVGEMVSAFLESPEVSLHVMGERVGGEDAHYHSLNVSILAMMLAKELGFSREMARELGVGALIHDVGMMKIPDRVTKQSLSECTCAERNLRAMHVEYGIEIGHQIGISKETLAVVAQHHEFADGSGYPNGLKEAAMSPAARVVSLVNYYDNLCNPSDISQSMTPHDALSLMFSKRRDKFEAKALMLMIRSLGVYPPGSIVQLSNEVMAAVISINPKSSLRPCVMLYDPNIPKERAIVLDLEQVPEISIVKSIKPTSLPPKVAAYLNSRKRVTYFFDGNDGAGGK